MVVIAARIMRVREKQREGLGGRINGSWGLVQVRESKGLGWPRKYMTGWQCHSLRREYRVEWI